MFSDLVAGGLSSPGARCGQSKGPQERWEEGGFLPSMSESLEQLDLLLVQVARKRRVQRSGIAFEGYVYIDPTLAAYVGEEVEIRYDPQDLVHSQETESEMHEMRDAP